MPEALLNYLGLMAWRMPGGDEKFSLDEMIEQFTLDQISLGSPVFDLDRLQWLNGRYIREQLTHETLIDRVHQWAANRDYFAQLVPLVQSHIAVLSDLGPFLRRSFLAYSISDPKFFSKELHLSPLFYYCNYQQLPSQLIVGHAG